MTAGVVGGISNASGSSITSGVSGSESEGRALGSGWSSWLCDLSSLDWWKELGHVCQEVVCQRKSLLASLIAV